MIKLQF